MLRTSKDFRLLSRAHDADLYFSPAASHPLSRSRQTQVFLRCRWRSAAASRVLRHLRRGQIVDRGAAFHQFAIDRRLLARTDTQSIPDHDRVEADFFICAIGANSSSGFRREIEQSPDCAAGLLARP
jgi:hypothetical protein